MRIREFQYTEETTCQPPPESKPEPATHEHCHIPQNCNTHENWLTDQHRNQRHRHVDSPFSEIAATRRPVSLSAQDIDVSTISRAGAGKLSLLCTGLPQFSIIIIIIIIIII